MSRKEGRKFDTVIISTRARDYTVEVRYVRYADDPTKRFLVEMDDLKFFGATPAEAVALAKAELEKMADIEWVRFIEIEYETRTPYRGFSHQDNIDPEDVIGLVLTFECWEYSKEPVADLEFEYSAQEYLRRRVAIAADGSEEVSREERHKLRHRVEESTDLVPFTAKRWQVLCEVKRGIARLDEMLREVFDHTDAKKLAAQLDKAKVMGLLPAAAPKGAT